MAKIDQLFRCFFPLASSQTGLATEEFTNKYCGELLNDFRTSTTGAKIRGKD